MRRLAYELERVPRLLRRIGLAPPRSPEDMTAEAIERLRQALDWERPTFAIHFAAVRQFLRWARSPLADDRRLWKLPSGEPSRRRWLTREQLGRLLRAARGPERVLVALEGLNGLRRVEVLRLRAKDVLLDEGCLRVLGKGRNGGKWRRIPCHPAVLPLLARWVRGKGPADPVLPVSRSGADALLQRAAVRARFRSGGIRVSHHDLRRTFGRLSYRAGMSLVQIKNLFGHASVDMTAHYIGVDDDDMRAGLGRLDRLMRSSA